MASMSGDLTMIGSQPATGAYKVCAISLTDATPLVDADRQKFAGIDNRSVPKMSQAKHSFQVKEESFELCHVSRVLGMA